MDTLSVALIVFGVCIALAVVFILIFVWAVKSGQFHDVEGVKFRMLEDDDPRRPTKK